MQAPLQIRRATALCLLIASCTVSAPAPAQEEGRAPPRKEAGPPQEAVELVPVLPLRIEDALRLAARNNTTVRIEALLPKQAGEDVRAARAVFEPELFGEVSASESSDPARVIPQFPVQVPEVTRNIYSGRFGIRQLVPTGGLFDLSFAPAKLKQSGRADQITTEFTATYTQPLLRGAWSDFVLRDVHITEAQRAAASLRFQRRVQDTMLDVVEAYWNLVFAEENYDVVRQALALAERQLERTLRRIEVGELAPLDRVADEAEVARRREELVTAETEIRSREDVLRRLLFDDSDGRLWERDLEPATPIGDMPASLDLDWRVIARQALRLRPDLRALRADVRVAEVLLTAAERDVLPRLDLTGSYTTDSSREQFGDAFDETVGFDFPDWSLVLELSVPIGNNVALAQRDRARLEVERSKRILYAAEMDVSLEVREAVRTLATLAESIARGRESVRLAETNLEREIARKEAGTSTQFQVQERNQELQEARSRLLRNKLDFRIAEANLLYVQGVLGPPEPAEDAR